LIWWQRRRACFPLPDFWGCGPGDQAFFQGPGAVPAGAPWTARKDFYRAEVPLDATDCDAKFTSNTSNNSSPASADGDSEAAAKPVFKIQKDPRVTSGRPFHPQV